MDRNHNTICKTLCNDVKRREIGTEFCEFYLNYNGEDIQVFKRDVFLNFGRNDRFFADGVKVPKGTPIFVESCLVGNPRYLYYSKIHNSQVYTASEIRLLNKRKECVRQRSNFDLISWFRPDPKISSQEYEQKTKDYAIFQSPSSSDPVTSDFLEQSKRKRPMLFRAFHDQDKDSQNSDLGEGKNTPSMHQL